jgi:hypothetical protein
MHCVAFIFIILIDFMLSVIIPSVIVLKVKVPLWCHDTQHNNNQHNETQHNGIKNNETQQNNKQNVTFNMTLSIMVIVLLWWESFMLNVIMLSITNKTFMMSVIMVNVIMLSVIMLRVSAPVYYVLHQIRLPNNVLKL